MTLHFINNYIILCICVKFAFKYSKYYYSTVITLQRSNCLPSLLHILIILIAKYTKTNLITFFSNVNRRNYNNKFTISNDV